MKRLYYLLVLIAALVLSAGCSARETESVPPTASEIYVAAMKKTESMKTGDIAITLEIDKEKSEYGAKYDYTDDANIKMQLLAVGGEEATGFSQIYTDGIFYSVGSGAKYKCAADAQTVKGIIGDNSAANLFGVEGFEKLSCKSSETGYVLEFECGGEKIGGYLKSFVSKAEGSSGYSIGNIKGTLETDGDYRIKAMEMNFSLDGGKKSKVKLAVTPLSLGETVVIAPPADAANYIEINPDSLGK